MSMCVSAQLHMQNRHLNIIMWSVDSISRDGPDTPVYAINYNLVVDKL